MLNKSTFANNPTKLDISRSKFDLSWRNSFSTRAGICQIVYTEETLPGDTLSLDASFVIRSTTPIGPTMDDLYADIYFFHVPNKLTLARQMMSPTTNDASKSWKAFIGAQDSLLNMPIPADGVQLPSVQVFSNSNVSKVNYLNSVADMLGLPQIDSSTASDYYSVNCLEPLAYACVWNNYFRDPNNQNPITIGIGSGNICQFYGLTEYGYNGRANIDELQALPACRMNGGYFTSALPWPQRNSTSVLLPLGETAPVVGDGSNFHSITGNDAIKFLDNGSILTNKTLGTSANGSLAYGSSGSSIPALSSTNMVVDLSQATAASVNQFRYAVQLQRWYECLARGGNSLSDMTVSMFGVTPHDVNADRPEYLGGKRVPLSISQVNTTSKDGLGTPGAFSLTTDKHHYFTKSFDTWGVVIGIMVIRPKESYCQGIARKYSRFDRMQFYWPQFANIGEQEILKKELFVQGTSTDDEVFGYQEAWAEYRYHNDQVCGVLRPTYSNEYAYWTYANKFSAAPSLASYINGNDLYKNVDQTLAVSQATAHFQFTAQFYFDVSAVRPMPTYSIPGLVDHH